MTVKQRLLEFLKAEGVSASEFSRKMNLSPAYISSMRKSMPEEKVERLVRIFPRLNRDWLLDGEGEMYRDPEESDRDAYRRSRRMVPLIPSQAYAGGFEMFARGVSADECQWIVSPTPGAELAIRVSGDSMEPKIHNKTILFMERINSRAFIPWGSPLVLDTVNGSLVKMLYPSQKGDDYFEARSYNPDYPPFDVPAESINGLYRILSRLEDGDTF